MWSEFYLSVNLVVDKIICNLQFFFCNRNVRTVACKVTKVCWREADALNAACDDANCDVMRTTVTRIVKCVHLISFFGKRIMS